MNRHLLLTLLAVAQIAMPLVARADDDYLAKIAEITRREQLLAQSKQLNKQLEQLEAQNERTIKAMEPVRAELKAAQLECQETCSGPATHALIDGIKMFSEISGASAATAAGVRYSVAYWAKHQSAEQAAKLGEVGSRFKMLSGAAVVASGVAFAATAYVNHYINLHDTVSQTQLASIKSELASMERTLSDSNSNVRRIVASNERITAALQDSVDISKFSAGK